jgi:crotonobetainyl-CoA:carnitine CoA-transferase CaiB-like acyl-CoA transferase
MGMLLGGITVVDVSRLLPGPFCSMVLADLGAEVIKIESLGVGDMVRMLPPFAGGESAAFLSVNHDKKSVAVNLRKDEGREIVMRLVRTADVFLEGFRPGQANRIGIGYEQLKTVNPRIVYCSLSGYGQDGPFRDRAGHDVNYAALSGLLHTMGAPAGLPFVPGVQIADLAGALFAAIGILAALAARNESGVGAYIDTSMFHSAFVLNTFAAASDLVSDTELPKQPGYLNGEFPCYNIYETKDGKQVSLGALEPEFWANFCTAIGREDLVGQQFPAEEERKFVIAEVARIFSERTWEEWAQILADRDVCCEPLNTVREALQHPQVADRNMVSEVQHPTAGTVKHIGLPLKASPQDPPREPTAPPLLGQHTAEILHRLGYSSEEIDRLRAGRVVATPDDVPRVTRRIFG